jgi:hypothetical protein
MKQKIKIKEIRPSVMLKGGILEIITSNKMPSWKIEDGDLYAGAPNYMRLIAASHYKLVAELLYTPEKQNHIPFFMESMEFESNEKEITIPLKISENHVLGTSPICDQQGNIYFIDLKELQKNQQSIIYKYNYSDEKVVPYITGIPAPTSLAYFEGVLFITSMVDRKLYRCLGAGDFEVYSQGLGSVFGLAINSLGEIYVGDQTGSLFKVDATGRASFQASLPESFKGYHFIFSPDNELYISLPSSVGKNYIYKMNTKREIEPFIESINILGGIAFSPEGDFHWIENSREEGIVYKKNKDGSVQKILGGNFLLGIAFNPIGDLIVTDLHCIYLIKKSWMEN